MYIYDVYLKWTNKVWKRLIISGNVSRQEHIWNTWSCFEAVMSTGRVGDSTTLLHNDDYRITVKGRFVWYPGGCSTSDVTTHYRVFWYPGSCSTSGVTTHYRVVWYPGDCVWYRHNSRRATFEIPSSYITTDGFKNCYNINNCKNYLWHKIEYVVLFNHQCFSNNKQ